MVLATFHLSTMVLAIRIALVDHNQLVGVQQHLSMSISHGECVTTISFF